MMRGLAGSAQSGRFFRVTATLSEGGGRMGAARWKGEVDAAAEEGVATAAAAAAPETTARLVYERMHRVVGDVGVAAVAVATAAGAGRWRC